MSITYPNLTHTQFPDAIDNIDNFVDITLETLPLAREYYSKYTSGDIAGAAQILADNPNLKYSYIGASSLNPIVDGLKATQLLFTQDVQQYLVEIVKYKGDWSGSVKYTKYNTVKYVNNSAWETFMCISTNTPIGTIPTDSTYWIPLTMRGERGEAGIGLSAHGSWDSIITYPKDALVAYNNALWGSRVENTGVVPSVQAVSTWYLIMEFKGDFTTYIDNVTQKRHKLIVENGSLYMEEVI